MPGPDKFEEALRGPEPELTFCFADVRCLWRVEAHKPNVRMHVVHSDGVAVDHRDVRGLDRLGTRCRRGEHQQQCEQQFRAHESKHDRQVPITALLARNQHLMLGALA